MADTDWNLHSKQLVTPTDEDRMLVEPSDETAKAVEVGGFRNWLMNTALFNTLTTTAKNIIGAIEEVKGIADNNTTQLNAFAYNCKVKTSANVAIAQDDNHIMSFGTVIKNEKNMFDTVGKTKINILKSGNYLILAEIIWDNSATGNRTATIRKNGSEYIGICKCYNAGADTLVQQVTALAYLEKGDYVEVVTVHNQTGGALSILCDSSLSIQKVGD